MICQQSFPDYRRINPDADNQTAKITKKIKTERHLPRFYRFHQYAGPSCRHHRQGRKKSPEGIQCARRGYSVFLAPMVEARGLRQLALYL
jgi:hypothetical protein